ncbi:MAG: cysteine--tRNA ligase, partial [Acidimicrobiia bacterium]
RYLTWIGYDVTFVRNVTDIDDKIIIRADELGLTTDEVAEVAFAEFTHAYDKLGNLRPTIEPKATDNIGAMISIIETLIERGIAYESDGDVYFAVRSFDGYGKLSRHDLDDLRSGERIEADPRKRDQLDFAMWKAAKPGEPNWPSPWGPGRPGWHIECSAMAAEFLGPAFDIHGGGTDLIFPHHENEIAQSEAATDEPFARYWMHNGMLNLSGEKMAKSTGHVVTLLESLDRWDPLAIRLFYLRTHYRKPLEFSADALADAEASLGRLRAFRRRAPTHIESPSDPASLEAFRGAMDNDLDAAGALGVVFDLVRSANALMDQGEDVEPLVGAFDEMMQVLGLDENPEDVPVDVSRIGVAYGLEDASIEDLLDLRIEARAEKDWARSDAIRDELASVGIVIEDTADGTRWHRD